MLLCIPFLACDWEQFNPAWVERGYGVEASLFDRRHILDEDAWARTKENVRRVATQHRPPSFTFHFPVNDCNYVADKRIEARLFEALELVDACGVDGMVLHSNQVHSVETWRTLDPARERDVFLRYVEGLKERIRGARFWVGLENMPIMGNDALELDPLFIFPSDFEGIASDNFGVTWDFCHYSYSVWVERLLREGTLREADRYPLIGRGDYLDFTQLEGSIVHWHFSAFEGVACASQGTLCTEGVAPWKGTVPEGVYALAFSRMRQSRRARTATLEIRERDYRRRETVFEVADWCRRQLSTPEATP